MGFRHRTGGPKSRRLPVDNGETYLAEALGSLPAQRDAVLRVAVWDNASTDRSLEICHARAGWGPSVEVHCNGRNIGAAATFNRAAERVRDTTVDVGTTMTTSGIPTTSPGASRRSRRNPTMRWPTPGRTRSMMKGSPSRHRWPTLVSTTLPWIGGCGPSTTGPHCDEHGRWSTSEIEGRWIPVYGVMWNSALWSTVPIGPYISSDTILLEDLLLNGRFVEAVATTFGKRDDPARSMRDSRAHERRRTWFTGRTSGRFLVPEVADAPGPNRGRGPRSVGTRGRELPLPDARPSTSLL